jgi:polysaccharide pyruvyl transferase CsaB
MSGEKKIVIAGAGTYGYYNSGDDAILRATAASLRAGRPDVKLSLISANPKNTYKPLGIAEIPITDIKAIMQEIRGCSLFLLGGGGLFYDYYGVETGKILSREHGGIAFYTGLGMLARLLDKPVMLYGVGVGPLFSEEGRRLTRSAFDCADVVTLRDTGSQELTLSLGISGEKIQVTADPAYLFEEEHRIDDILAKYKLEELHPLIGVVLREWKTGKHPMEWVKAVGEALDGLVEKLDAHPLFIPLHATTTDESDSRLMQSIMDGIRNKKKVVLLSEKATSAEKAALIGKCDVLLGMRLHSILFAIKQGVPFAALEYDPKVEHMLADSGLAEFGLALEGLNASALENLLEKVYTNRVEIRQRLAAEGQRAVRMAQRSTELALALMDQPEGFRRAQATGEWLPDLTLELVGKNEELFSQIDRLQNEAQKSHVRFQKDVDHFNGLLEKQLAEINANKDTIYALNAAVAQNEFDNTGLRNEINGLKTVIEQKTGEMERLTREIEGLEEKVERQETRLTRMKDTLRQAEMERTRLAETAARQSTDLDWYRHALDAREFLHKESPLLRWIDRIFRGLVLWDRYGFQQLLKKIGGKSNNKPSRQG